MGFNIAPALWRFGLPICVCLIIYLIGVGHGRKPFILAAQMQSSKAKIIEQQHQKIKQSILNQESRAHEILQNNECYISADAADILSDIRAF